jgi:hypothetical protein
MRRPRTSASERKRLAYGLDSHKNEKRAISGRESMGEVQSNEGRRPRARALGLWALNSLTIPPWNPKLSKLLRKARGLHSLRKERILEG